MSNDSLKKKYSNQLKIEQNSVLLLYQNIKPFSKTFLGYNSYSLFCEIYEKKVLYKLYNSYISWHFWKYLVGWPVGQILFKFEKGLGVGHFHSREDAASMPYVSHSYPKTETVIIF